MPRSRSWSRNYHMKKGEKRGRGKRVNWRKSEPPKPKLQIEPTSSTSPTTPTTLPDDSIISTEQLPPTEKQTREQEHEVPKGDREYHCTYLRPSASGPRLSSVQEFVSSPFADPPTLSDPQCAYFASENILNALTYYLPFELALIVWYNKTRAESRICAACQRFYRLGEKLPSLIRTDPQLEAVYDGPQREREKWISGLCSFMCFGITLVNAPGIGLNAWGRFEHEIDQQTLWLINNSQPTVDDQGLGRLFKLTRKPDAGTLSFQVSSQTPTAPPSA
ncbi:uncharacterized protein EI90DRAFT_2979154 [Cantharellus anzutake]|uniref:uncharacterized protein n=1 Tax=Cantharellus anzutake TaxID=1750568 RepID=UPI001908EF7C|nr:uncharacterized protein EI90DRAFT_2979154 [Cantharellus anzutake]KAF8317278.1 hypothetical protein EI90DRAFT_2979154 [Cantharellus anzutake]